MDPSVSLVLLQSPDTVPLKRAAQSFVQNLAAQYNVADVADVQKHRFQCFRNTASLNPVWRSTYPHPNLTDSLLIKMEKYVCKVKQGVFTETPLEFWRSREAVYPNLAPVALDLFSAPASQAFVERIFSLCGLLSSGLSLSLSHLFMSSLVYWLFSFFPGTRHLHICSHICAHMYMSCTSVIVEYIFVKLYDVFVVFITQYF